MSYKLIYIFSFIFFIGCSNTNIKNNDWKDSKSTIYYMDKLQTGDIIIKNKVFTSPLTWFGHVGVMVSDSEVGEYPKLGTGYHKTKINFWLFDERKIIVLRYNKFDDKFKEIFLRNLKKYSHSNYGLLDKVNDSKDFYCSKFVWLIYFKTVKDLNYDSNFNLNKNKIFIFPYDFTNFSSLTKVNL